MEVNKKGGIERMNRMKWKWIALPLVLLIVIVTGCQAVAGFDINKALLQSMKPLSSESRQTMSVELVPGTGTAISAEDNKVIELINSLSLTVDNAKVQDLSHASIKGTVGFDGNKLPFHLFMDDKGLTVQMEGAKQPIYISLDSYTTGIDMSSYQEQMQNFSLQATEFVLKHLPNPSKVSVQQGRETVNGESLNLTNLQLEIRGDELVGLLKPFLANIAKDEQGLKDLVNTFYDVFYPLMSAEMGSDLYEPGVSNGLPESKAVAVAALNAALQEELNKLLANYDQAMADLFAETPELATILGKDTVFKMNLYFDSKLDIRKEKLELSIALPAMEDLPIQAIKLRVDSEMWNVGGAVNADPVNTAAGVINLMDDTLTPGQMLRNFDQGSTVYKLLKDDLKITNKYVLVDPYNDYYGVIMSKNTTFVPLRYISEELDAQVKWASGSNQIVIIDDITGAKIIVTKGSKQASVNGQPVTLAQPVFVHKDGTTYVPLRFIAEALGASVHVDEEGWISIERP